MADPFLDADEILAHAAAGTLPRRFRTRIAGGGLAPTLVAGAEVRVRRAEPRVGAAVCVAHAGRLAWRRVLARAGTRALLRADVAPFADGWFEGVLGVVESPRLVARVAERFPVAWTSSGWWVAWLVARARALARRRSVARGRLAGTAVPLGAADQPSFQALYARVFGGPATAYRMPAGDAVAIGLRDARLGLIGSATLRKQGRHAYCHALLVDPAARGRGGAQALLRALVAQARAAGASRVLAHVNARNVSSLAAFARVGFAPTGRWRDDPDDALRAAEYQMLELAIDL